MLNLKIMVSITLKEACVVLSMGGKQTLVLRNGCELLEKKNNEILKRSDLTSN